MFQYLLLSEEVTPQHFLHIITIPRRNYPGFKVFFYYCYRSSTIFVWMKKIFTGRKNWENLKMDQVSIQSFFMPVNIPLTLQYTDSTEETEVHTVMHSYSSLALEWVKAFLIWKHVSPGEPKVRSLLKWNWGKIRFQHEPFPGIVSCLRESNLV